MSRSRTQATPIQATKLQQEAEKLGQILEKLQEERAGLREDTRVAHEAIQDLATATSRAAEFILTLANESVKRTVHAAVKKGLEEYTEAQAKALKKAEQSVYDRFDLLAAILLGEDYEAHAKGSPPMDELIRRYVKVSGAHARGISIIANDSDDLSAFVKPDVKPGEVIA